MWVTFTYIYDILSSFSFAIIINLLSLTLKIILLSNLVNYETNSTKIKRSWLLLIVVLISSIACDLCWVFRLLKDYFSLDYRPYLFWLRITWGLYAIQFHALILCFENLVSSTLTLRHKIAPYITGSFFLFALYISIGNFNCNTLDQRPAFEESVRTLEVLYLLYFLIPMSILIIIQKVRSDAIPRILKHQFNILIPCLMIPLWISELIQMNPLDLIPINTSCWRINILPAAHISTLLLTVAIYYCTRRMMALRFLNIRNHVEVKTNFSFITGFKDVLERLSHATTNAELNYTTKTLINESFGIPFDKTKLYIRHIKINAGQTSPHAKRKVIESLVEGFLSTHGQTIIEHLRNIRILIYDELSFNNFYEQNQRNTLLLQFLDTINADIFMPIYEKNNMTAYIIIERNARLNTLYGNTERDEMLVYAGYLGNIINLLQTHNLNTIVQQEKDLNDELYHKHQIISQYKESIRSFLRTTQEKEIGIIFYQSRRFVFGNKAARDLIQINLNTQEGHPLTRILKNIARQVEEYKTPITSFALDINGNKLVLSGVPNLESNNIIITIHYPEVSDIIKTQIDLLNDPTKWDYLLYLETTESGKLINKLIPGSGEIVLNFKIDLLKTTLSKKAILLEMPEDDVMPTVEIIHHISLGKQLHHLKLNEPVRSPDILIKLVGMNRLFGAPSSEKPLLEELNEHGTLFIENVHLLDLETQGYLAEFLQYGMYRPYKSEQKIMSSVRVICSTAKNLQTLVDEGGFSKELLKQFKSTTVNFPSLLTLPHEEFNALAQGFTEQTLQDQTLKNILDLSASEKARISHMRPVSLYELKNNVQQLLIQKSKKNMVYEETQCNPAYALSDPDLVLAARLGKQALKDPEIMTTLWNKLQSQTKIAAFLGVNRSSVNRRCKDYHLL